MPYKDKNKQLRYMKWWRRNHKEEGRNYMREYRAKKKLLEAVEKAKFDYEMGILPIRTENWRIENETTEI